MKRNMDIARAILQKVEECDSPYGLSKQPEIEDFTKDEISYHVKLLLGAGLIEADDIGDAANPLRVMDLNLTWYGQDFLSAANDDSIWNKGKRKNY